MASIPDSGVTFSLDVSSVGASLLRKAVMTKLSEFMGSYTDDVLAEYVVVLVGHGKHQTQAVKDLEAFLGDQSEAFVTWLWDHLCSNIHLYTPISKPSSPKDGFGSTEYLVQDRSKEPIKSIHADAQSEEKNRVQVSSVTCEGGRLARLRRDFGKDGDLMSGKDLGMVASVSGREDTGLHTGDFENDRTVTNELSRGRECTRSAKRPRSPDSWAFRERNASDERLYQKRHLSPPRVNATRRLLQSAVREAVAPATRHSRRSDSSLKRLRSVVSADVENSESVAELSRQLPLKGVVQTDGIRQGKRVMPAMIMAMKAAAAAAEDATKVRGMLIGSVWDRLGKKSAEVVENKEEAVDVLARDGGEGREAAESRFVGATQRGGEQKAMKRARLGSDDRVSQDSTGDDAVAVSDSMIDEYTEGPYPDGRSVYAVRGGKYQADERNDEGFARDVSYSEGQRVRAKDRQDQSREESVTVQYRLAQNMDGDVKETHKQKGSNVAAGLANSSQKIVNISVNVNTWKPRPYEKLKDSAASEQPMASTLKQSQDQPDKASNSSMLQVHDAKQLEEETDIDPHVMAMKKKLHQGQQEMSKLCTKQSGITKEVQKPASHVVPGAKAVQKCQDDTDTRTVFVANIHFAATKESVTAHFTQCGDIERIVMLTDGATGQPKGSAYIEFNTRDAADKALALNESSFYSRVLKVVRKNAAIQAMQETAPLLIRSTMIRRPIPLALRVPLRGRFLRASPYLMRRFPSMPRPYGNFPSLQWKRDTVIAGGSTNPTLSNGNRPGYGLQIHPGRSLSYVRSPSNATAQNIGTMEEHKVVTQQGISNEIKSDLLSGTQEQKRDTEIGQAELEQGGGGG